MRVIVDTNVLVSATIADGKPEIVIDFIADDDGWDWIVSEAILDEYKDVLNRPKLKLSDAVKQKYLSMVERVTTTIEVEVEVFFPRDRKDEKFLACAIAGDVDFLITGDKDFEEMQALLPKTIITSVAVFKELAMDA